VKALGTLLVIALAFQGYDAEAGGIGKAVKKVTKKVSGAVKKVGEAAKKAVKKVGKVIQKRIIGPILKKIKAAVAKLFKPVVNKVMPFLTKLAMPLIQKSIGRGGQFGVNSLSKWATYLKDGQLDVDRIKGDIKERITGWVMPKLKDKVDSVLGKGIAFIRKFTDPIVSSAVGGIGSIPFVGGLLAGVASTAYNMGMKELQKVVATQVFKFIEKGMGKLFDGTIGKLVTKLLPKVNRFLAKSGIGPMLGALLGGVPGGQEKVAAMVAQIKAKAKSWTPELAKKAEELAQRIVVSDHKLGEIEAEAKGETPEQQARKESKEDPIADASAVKVEMPPPEVVAGEPEDGAEEKKGGAR
jgi:hypothetical protein